jgi:SAM-dependent methyltransferase
VTTNAGPTDSVAARFRRAYTALRAREGRGRGGERELLDLPYVASGAWAPQWRVRARTFDRFVRRIVTPMARCVAPRPLHVLDLGSGNGWLCYRLHHAGHTAVAVDWRTDCVDGLGAARGYGGHVTPLFSRVAASFEALPFDSRWFDVVVFNASLHYATNLARTLAQARAVLGGGGRIAILDSPFYRNGDDGEAMVCDKHAGRTLDFGQFGADLLSLPSIEYLTRARLLDASVGLGLAWKRHRVLYPLRYELRPLWAAIRRRRAPSRFDLWEGRIAVSPDA